MVVISVVDVDVVVVVIAAVVAIDVVSPVAVDVFADVAVGSDRDKDEDEDTDDGAAAPPSDDARDSLVLPLSLLDAFHERSMSSTDRIRAFPASRHP